MDNLVNFLFFALYIKKKLFLLQLMNAHVMSTPLDIWNEMFF